MDTKFNPGNSQPPSWEQSALERVLRQLLRDRVHGRIWSIVRWLIIFAFLLIIFFFVMPVGKDTRYQEDHTAVISLQGVINTDTIDDLQRNLQAAYQNPHVKGIIIRANSPGGAAASSSVGFDEIRYLKSKNPNIPLYLVTEDICASGCYYIASAADKIFANQNSIVGSIGVIHSGFDFSDLLKKIGIKRRLKYAGRNKAIGDPFVDETAEQKAILQGMLDETHRKFIADVKLGRGNRLQLKKDPDIFTARIYVGSQAKANGLIDDYGNVFSVARDIIKAPKLVNYPPKTWLNINNIHPR